MRIVTWNVNGLRAALNKGAWQWVQENGADAICFQEIKATPAQLSAEQHALFQDFCAYWNPAQRAGYSGVVTFARQKPLDIQLGMGIPDFDNEGRLIRTQFPDFQLFNIYFPNGKRDQGRVDFKLEFYASLLAILDQMHAEKQRIVLCGDFNTAHREIDLRNPKANSIYSGFLPEERAWIDTYLQHGFVDPFRALYPERVQYTWWTYRMGAREKNVGWRIDYFLVSEGLMPSVKDIITHDQVGGSDHCPVELILS